MFKKIKEFFRVVSELKYIIPLLKKQQPSIFAYLLISA